MSSFVSTDGASGFDGTGRRFYAGRCFAFWQDGVRALGTVMWGRPLEADVEQMIPFLEVGAQSRFMGHASFVDGRAIESVDLLAFKKLLGYLIARRHAWGPNIRRQAMLHSGGVVGVTVAGAMQVVRPPYSFHCFEAAVAQEAFDWCGVEDLFLPVEAVCRTLVSTPRVVRLVQSLFRTNGLLSKAEIARKLGLSVRTLQRRLDDAGTSLRTERNRYLTLQIDELLAGTELDLDAIASRVGLASAAHLVRHFRKAHGMTPGAWRTLQRRGVGDASRAQHSTRR